MKILFTTPVLEYPLAGGPVLRIGNSIKALNKISELYILSRVSFRSLGGGDAEEYYREICHHFKYIPSVRQNIFTRIRDFRFRGWNRNVDYLLNIPIRIISKIFNATFLNDVRYITRFVKRHQINIIWFGYGNISFDLMQKLKKHLPEVKMVCDTDSVWSRFVLRELDNLNDDARRKEIEETGKRKEWEEKEWSVFMDVTTAVSEVDAEYYRSISKASEKVKIFSNVIDPDMYIIKPQPPSGFRKPCIYLAGTFWKESPMEQAARWLISEVLPLIYKQIPNIHLYIIGKDSDKILADINEPNITITGKLDSVLPYLCNVNVSVVPLKFESGTRFKILEAGACGIPIVSTSLGAEGIPVTDGFDILIADEAGKFAESIIEIIHNEKLSDKLSNNCKALIQKNYSIDTLVGEGEIIIDFLIDKCNV